MVLASPARSSSLVLSVLVAAACGTNDPEFVSLADGYRAPPPATAVATWSVEGSPVALRSDPVEPSGVWIEHSLAPDAWRRLEGELGLFAARPRTGGLRHHEGERVQLRIGALAPRLLSEKEFKATGDADVFAVSGEAILLRLGTPEERPTEPARLSAFLERGQAVDGAWRTSVERISGPGIPLWTGERVALPLSVSAGQALRFRFAFRPLADREGDAAVTLSVARSGEPLWSAEVWPGPRKASATREAGATRVVSLTVPLPRTSAEAVFTLALDGTPGIGALFDPVLGPLEVGSFGDRPWSDPRPNLVLFVADTLRADALAAWGGAPDVAPNLNALAARARRFPHARATSVWTLPTHASMFTGLFPLQHGAVAKDRTFPAELVTIAEHLAAFGYRTGAITEGGFVSRHYGLDQGFGFFDEKGNQARSLARTLADAQAFLEHDDGRPVFLLVHTYRVHAPYRRGPEEDESANDALLARIATRIAERGESEVTQPVIDEFVDEYRALYLDGVRDLDAQFGGWFRALESSGVLERGALLFTSDHGEEFYEHGNRFHGWAPNEEKVRIPLLLFGATIEPGEVPFGASQVDLPPTLAALAGVPPLEQWEGEDLLRLARERTLLAYNRQDDGEEYLAGVLAQRKVIAGSLEQLSGGEPDQAYDLSRDPAEATNLAGRAEGWPSSFSRDVAEQWLLLSEPVGAAGGVTLDEAALQDLQGLGYVE